MFCVPRRLRRQRPSRGFLPSAIRSDRFLAALAVAILAAASPACAQPGCGRCGDSNIRIGPFSFPNPFASPPAATSTGERVQRSWERRESSGSPSRRAKASSGHVTAAKGGSLYVCVRTCDDSFFPLPYTGSSGAVLEDICRALCPNAEMALFTMPFGGTIDQGASPRGSPYTSQPYAMKFQQTYDGTCSCRRAGQSWADALAPAEAKYSHRSHDIIVTAKMSADMARPKSQPAGKPPAADDADPENAPPLIAGDVVYPGLDVNGVDTKLKAAAEAVSRETSGIQDERAKADLHFGLSHGQIVEEDDPDGGRRKVRIVAPIF